MTPAAARGEHHPVTLSAAHRHELEQASAIDTNVIAERGYRTLDRRQQGELAALGITLRTTESFPGLLLPMFRATGEQISTQFKPAKPITIRGRPVKYLSPFGQGNRLDVHPRNHAHITDITVPLWITEGIKKGDSLTSRGCCVVTITGVFNWRGRLATLGDWEDVPIKRRDVVLCFDADARKNISVARAMVRLGHWCLSKGAKSVRFLIVPGEMNGTATKGADDYFAAGGTLATLEAAATTTAPETETADDTFSDSRLAETIADEVLVDRYVWCKGLGWLAWNGQRWMIVTDEAVGEAVRQYVLHQFVRAVTAGKSSGIHGWQSMLRLTRQRAVLSLCKGIVEHSAEAFDADLDLLNTPTGIVNLRTGQIQAHDPGLLITKITRGTYRPDYTHPDWDKALSALTADVHTWLQVRIGQAITGHPTPDGVIPILQGSGENGKSALTTDGILPALGDYADTCSPKLITTAKGEHSTERADLRAQRFLVAEELTEDRALNVTAIKQITDVGKIRARYVHKDNFSFVPSHSLFITTNYVPIVNETDHGTWRRLALVTFPFTFRKPSEALIGPTDRRGDLRLKPRLRAGAGGQHDAIVTWAIEGAIRWFAQPDTALALPDRVDDDTRAWRRQADCILGFWSDMLVADPEACALTTDMQQTFNAWMKANDHHEWSKELFGSRFRSHTETQRHKVEERRPRNLDGRPVSRPLGLAGSDVPHRPYVYLGVRFRKPGETEENPSKTGTWSERSDPPGIPAREGQLEKVPEGLDHLDQSCCEGGLLTPGCKLCKRSPTYWQRQVPQ